ncbi:MAG: S8 family serine peptidase [Candidatus Thalassarchaeaceae archaeon]
MTGSRLNLHPLLIAAMLIILDFSIASSALPTSENSDLEVNDEISERDLSWPPALMCGQIECELTDRSVRMPPFDAGFPVEEPEWWFGYWYDLDSDGMDDRLQRIIAGERESISSTSIIGDDGKGTVAIVVDYAWHPGPSDISELLGILENHGWEKEGSWFFQMDVLDSVVLDHVPVSALIDIWQLDGVIMIEEQNVLVPYLDTAPRGSKVRSSDVYSDTLQDFGYDGSGIVIAILDTGVDNEHFSLDDFSDNNNDNTNEPNDLADPKWIAGCDATSFSQNDCSDGNFDPDDGDGHGTHVAGIALGTGDSRRENQGYAPGSYLIDVKVFTDIGNTNSAAILKGINWVAANADNDWGNNDSSNGIDVMSMSFGSASSPTGNDPGDNGSNAEARAVDAAADAGVVPVAAIGNDGYRRVTSVGASDSAITVGSIEDKDTINRDDDSIASYSNSGPREDDGDDDDQDELKPDVVAPGSDIMSASHAASTSPIPGTPKALAEDSYVEMSGTSMACPAVAGFVAVLLNAAEEEGKNLDPDEVKQLLHEFSDSRGSASQPSASDTWNDKYGFGIIDGTMALSGLIDGTGGGGGGGNNSTGGGDPPPPVGDGEWLEIHRPIANLWLIEGETYTVKGNISEQGHQNGTIEEVKIKITYTHKPEDSPTKKVVLVDWHTAQGTENWSTQFSIPDFAEDEINAQKIEISLKARNEFDQWSESQEADHNIGRVKINLSTPRSQELLEGDVIFQGDFETVNGGSLQWRIGKEDWVEEFVINTGQGGHSDSYSFNWDSTQFPDGPHRISLRILSGGGIKSEEVRMSIEIDNIPPAPDLMFRSGITVSEWNIPIGSTYVNSFVDVSAEIRNDGDELATDVVIYLLENGVRKYELTLPSIEAREIVTVTLYWNPLEVGTQNIALLIDPENSIDEIDEEDNYLEIGYSVLPRPEGVDLSFRPGAIETLPAIPRPEEQFQISAKIENLGSGIAENVEVELYLNTGRGWELTSSTIIQYVQGASSEDVNFAIIAEKEGPLEIKIKIGGEGLTDLQWDNNEIEWTLFVDKAIISGERAMNFALGESPVEIIYLGEEGIVITSLDGGLSLYRLNSDNGLTACTNTMEDIWSGDLAVASTDDEYAHIVWTRRFLDTHGFLKQTISYSTIDSSCVMTPIQDLIQPILLSDGKYWGIDMDLDGTEILISGYLRDTLTGGSNQDLTSIFVLQADAPTSSGDWALTPNVISDIDVISGQTDPVQIEFGEDEQGHILYQSMRNDTSGIDRLGLWYSHGDLDISSWGYKKAVGDEASLAKMYAENIDGESRLIVSWREGNGVNAKLVSMIVDDSFNVINNQSIIIDALGMSNVRFQESSRGIQIMYDMVGPNGPQIHYGMINAEENWIAISNKVRNGWIHSMDRAPSGSETAIIHYSNQGWKISTIFDDSPQDNGPVDILEQLRITLELDKGSFNILLGGIALAILLLCTIVLGALAVRAVNWMGGSRKKKAKGSVMLEEDVVDVIDEDDIFVEPEDTSLLVEIVENEPMDTRSSRRIRREMKSNVAEMATPNTPPIVPEQVVAEPLPALNQELQGLDLPELIPLNRLVICPECSSRFEVSKELTVTRCPICAIRIDM